MALIFPDDTIAVAVKINNAVKKHMDKSYGDMRAEFDRAVFCYALKRYKGNVSRAAKELDIDRNTLKKRIKELDIKK